MKLFTQSGRFIATLALLLGATASSQAQEANLVTNILEIQQYERAIHIMAMLLIGFGFLMVFVRKYFGMNGHKQAGQTIRVSPFRP